MKSIFLEAFATHDIFQDNPIRVAEIMIEFWRRNERVIVGVKKVGDA
jgi:protein phosphatase methylesterase 1